MTSLCNLRDSRGTYYGISSNVAQCNRGISLPPLQLNLIDGVLIHKIIKKRAVATSHYYVLLRFDLMTR